MSNDNNIIKSIIPCQCPKCGNDILVEYQSSAPQLISIMTVDDIASAKKSAIERVKALPIGEDKIDEAIKWIENDDTVFGPNEVDSIISFLLKQTNIE